MTSGGTSLTLLVVGSVLVTELPDGWLLYKAAILPPGYAIMSETGSLTRLV